MKRLLVLAMIVFVGGAANAQLSGGLKAGLNLSSNQYKVFGQTSESKERVGFQFGGFLSFDVSDFISLSPELVYSQMGNTDQFDGVDYKLNLSYISIPVMAKIKFAEVFNIQAGPQFGLLLGAKSYEGNESMDVKEDYKSTDFGIALGAGVELTLGLLVDFRFYQGMNNIDNFYQISDFVEKNRAFQLTVGYRLFGN